MVACFGAIMHKERKNRLESFVAMIDYIANIN